MSVLTPRPASRAPTVSPVFPFLCHVMDVQLHSLGADNLPTGGMMSLVNEQEVVRRAGRQAISAFLDCHNCFSVLRNSGKVVVFDRRIPVQLAFYALVEHGAWARVPFFGSCGLPIFAPVFLDSLLHGAVV